MDFDLGVITKHPYLIGGIVLAVGGYIVYRVYESSAAAASPTDLSSEAEFQQLQSAQALTDAQDQSQIDLTNTQANAQIAVINADYSGQLQLAQQGQSVYDDYLATQYAVTANTNQTSQNIAQIQGDTAIGVTQIEGDVADSQIAAEAQNQANIVGLTAYLSTHPGSTGGVSYQATSGGETFSGSGANIYTEERGNIPQTIAALEGQATANYSATSTSTSSSTPISFNIPGLGSVTGI